MAMDLLEEALRHRKDRHGSAFVTLTRTRGSTPRKAGAKMLVVDRGNAAPVVYGTIGGGSLEEKAVEEALEVIRSAGTPVCIVKDLGKDLSMACGGGVEYFIEPLGSPFRLVICGGGHIGLALYNIMKTLDFRITVADVSRNTANGERFPEADMIVPSFDECDLEEGIRVDGKTFIVIVSRDHPTDFRLARYFFDKPWAYLGVIASRGKAAVLKDELRHAGKPEEKINRIASPIGIPLGGSEPEEIAVSIAAEILQARYLPENGQPAIS